jgi:superfamily II DNA/RNA helicase
LHGDLGQGAREQALRALRNGKIDVLIATDVAARGIDVEDVTHVVNFQAPEDERTYLHRIGRTGRAGNKGTAVTFVDWDDLPRWSLINKILDLGHPEPVETYSTSAHLFAELGIPAGTTGRLPRAQRTLAGLDAEVLEDLGETGRRNSPQRARGTRDGHGERGSHGGGKGHGGKGHGGKGHDEKGGKPRDGGRDGLPKRSAGEASGHASSDAPKAGRSRNRRRTRGGKATGDAGAPH